MLWFVVPVEPGISWEGHLSGLLVGLAFAYLYKQQISDPPKYEWEKPDYNEEDDEFMKHFDENGNFIERLPGEEIKEDELNDLNDEGKQKIVYRYFFKKSRKDSND